MNNKKAVSLMVSYVLLIVITISLAVLVYSWLKLQANIEEMPKCPEDVSLIIVDYNCLEENIINLSVKNQGNFNIDGMIVRGTELTDEEAIPATELTDPESTAPSLDKIYYFGSPGEFKPLEPGVIYTKIFSYSSLGETAELKKIQIEPFRTQEDKKGKSRMVLCDKSILTQKIDCTTYSG